MKIRCVIVDELPATCERCRFISVDDGYFAAGCNLTYHIIMRLAGTSRPSDCPLALEHDNKKIANEVV